MKKPTKTKAVKAKKMWRYLDHRPYHKRENAANYSGVKLKDVKHVALIPIDAESVESMVEQMARALFSDTYKNYLHFNPSLFDAAKEYEINFYKAQARAALAAIGIKGGAK